MFNDTLLKEVRDQFHHVDSCPYQGRRIFFENAGGALTLKSVAETSGVMAAIPDNQGRDNPASRKLVDIIDTGKCDIKAFLGATGGTVFVGESGTELLFRLVRTAVLGAAEGGIVLGSTLEHPATSSSSAYWAEQTGRSFVQIPHSNSTGTVSRDDYLAYLTPETRIATILHTSPVTGMSVDVQAVASAIRSVSPDCYIIVDGIQHAAHGGLDIDAYDIDGYVISPYKVFSRHGYGIAWVSPRFCALPHERLRTTPDEQWELGTRDTASYATFTDVVNYFEWLGSQFTNSTNRRERLMVAGVEISNHEKALVDAMIEGVRSKHGNQRGLQDMSFVSIIGGAHNESREGLVALNVAGVSAQDVVEHLGQDGIRVHVRKADHYSGNILVPLKLDSCVRVSMCHYNSVDEVRQFLMSMEKLRPR